MGFTCLMAQRKAGIILYLYQLSAGYLQLKHCVLLSLKVKGYDNVSTILSIRQFIKQAPDVLHVDST
jgi:hypothetical protein